MLSSLSLVVLVQVDYVRSERSVSMYEVLNLLILNILRTQLLCGAYSHSAWCELLDQGFHKQEKALQLQQENT